MLLKLEVKVLSSAKRVNLTKFEHVDKSLMNIRNRRGPSMGPHGTPDVIEQRWEMCPFKDTNCLLSAQ